MAKVRQLSPILADKIAAGEVVERPASVVKELIENSLDAEATKIVVRIDGGGLAAISVTDNGWGMSPADARLALNRHATSKIFDEADLFRVSSLGFRGEALPSLASVSKMTLTTRETGAETGLEIRIVGGEVESSTEIGSPVGTTVLVQDLFFNTPARLKFMKTPKTEIGWIKEAIIRAALTRPEIRFELHDGPQARLILPVVSDRLDRISDVLGASAANRLIEVEHAHPAVRVKGYISLPEDQKATGRSVYLFVNKRYIQDRAVMSGLLAGYQGRLDSRRYPLAVLDLELEPGTVDVNVHPAKMEVRFHHAQAIRQAVLQAVGAALRAKERFIWKAPQTSNDATVAEQVTGLRTSRSPAVNPSASGTPNWNRPIQPRPITAPPPFSAPQSEPEPLIETRSGFRYLGTYADLYLIGQVGPDLVLIDQHAAHERILFDKLTKGPVQSEPLLVEAVVDLEPTVLTEFEERFEEAARLGLILEQTPDRSDQLRVKALPAILRGRDPKTLVRDLVHDLSRGQGAVDDPPSGLAEVLAGRACKAAIKAGQSISRAEVETLVDSLGRLEGPLTCPHGRPIIRRLSRREVDGFFKRT